MVVAILDEWGLDAAAQIALLGLPARTRPREMIRYRRGTALPGDAEVLERCRQIVCIHHALALLFPHNPYMAAAWVSASGNRYFGRAPLSVMLEEGLAGMTAVCDLLENRSEWAAE